MDISLLHTALLFVTAIWAGALNAIAGGGTFFTFPVLLLIGMPPIIANTTNKCALSFASLSGVAGFWREIRSIRPLLGFYCSLAVLGSLLGSTLLLVTPDARFSALIPWLMLSATCLFACGGRLARFIQSARSRSAAGAADTRPHQHSPCAVIAIGMGQFAIGVYGGFFAAGMGILMMALYELAGMRNIHEMNALKSVVGLCINVISALTFLFTGTLDSRIALILIAGALLGGYGGAILSKRLPAATIRGFIVFYGAVMSLYFFVQR